MNILFKFIGGLIFTLAMVLIIPWVITDYIQPVIVDAVGDYQVASLSSDTIVSILIFVCTMAFCFVLGGSSIFRIFGVVGVIGLIVAYYLLGDVKGAILPIIMLCASLLLSFYLHKRKEKKKAEKQKRKEEKKEAKKLKKEGKSEEETEEEVEEKDVENED